ncbi:hypothetical protein WJX73_006457 [Symbiochloris irregularis]|uniref:isoleucine--tRNA ligase n=1 Tax=Symbiochloris irregularis TaxID=706552 RepID=A0AAW1Q0H7_9CHLO
MNLQHWGVQPIQRGVHTCSAGLHQAGTLRRGGTGMRAALVARWGMCTPLLMQRAALRSRTLSTSVHAKKKNEDDSPYRTTVNLPQTKFNMRANSKQREPELQKWWQKSQVYEKLSQENAGEPFILHDGPPYANGDLHIGHALNKILKDVIVKFQLLQGRKATYRPGWDCHGLPIELKVVQSLSEDQRAKLDTVQLRRKARDFALKTVKSQCTQFQRYGVWGEWDQPYLTLSGEYEAAQLRVFARMVAAGHIYRGRKPVHWSPSSRTALAEAELEYPDGHTSTSIYVAMPLASLGPHTPPEAAPHLEGAHLAIWTTTPWTIPANSAVAVNADLQYAVVQTQREDMPERLVIAEGLVEAMEAKLECKLKVLATVKGAELEGAQYRHPLSGMGGELERTSPLVVGGDYITLDAGTGLVHTAPGHGVEDYQVGQKYDLPVRSPLDDGGIFTAEAGSAFQGKSVLGDGNTAVVSALREASALLKAEKYGHRYPYDWRTKQPVIFRATEQWFASVEGFKAAAMEAIEGVQWIPSSGIARITSMTQSRSDWCISRQRKWGVPLPVFYDNETGEAVMSEEVIEHVAGVVAEKGTDVWWAAPIEALLPPSLQDRASSLTRGQDTMDVWFDSGCSWASVLGGMGEGAHAPQPGQAAPTSGLGFPAQLYLEGSDQHRGWFQSSLLTSVAVTGTAPYRQVLTHGFVLDERGVKMSKSVGNVTDPRQVIDGGKDAKADPPYGADVLRLWVASVDFTGDVLIGAKILAQTSEVYRKLRFTLRYLLGNLHDFDPAHHTVPHAMLPLTDRYMLHRLAELLKGTEAHYQSYQFNRAFQALQRFAVQDLSNFYLDIAKDRLYIRAADSPDRRACQTVMAALVQGLCSAVAPMAPHLAEDAWSNLPFTAPADSVFQAGWRKPDPAWSQMEAGDLSDAKAVAAVRHEVNQVVEEARRNRLVGASLEARILLHFDKPHLAEALSAWNDLPNGIDPLRYAFIVSQVDICSTADEAREADYTATVNAAGHGTVTVGVARARGHKCQRCWNFSEAVGSTQDHPQLCERCVPVVQEMGMAPQPAKAADPAGMA